MSNSPKVVDLSPTAATVRIEDDVFIAFVTAFEGGAQFSVAGPTGDVFHELLSYDGAVKLLLDNGFGRIDAEGGVLLAQAAVQDEV